MSITQREIMNVWKESGRAGQDRTGQDRTGQDRTGKDTIFSELTAYLDAYLRAPGYRKISS